MRLLLFIILFLAIHPCLGYTQIEPILILEDENYSIYDFSVVRYSPDGKKILAAAGGLSILWDADTGERLFYFDEHMRGENPGAIYDGEFSRDGKLIATAGATFHAIVWEAETGKIVQTFSEPTPYPYIPFYAVAISPDNKNILTAGENISMKLWDMETGNIVDDTKLHGVRNITWFPDGERVIAYASTYSKIYSLKTKGILLSVPGSSTLSNDGKELRVIKWWVDGMDVSNQLELWDTDTYELIRKESPFTRTMGEKISVSPNGKRILIGKSEESANPIRIVDVETGSVLRTLTLPSSIENKETDYLQFSPDGNRVAIAIGDRILIYDVSDLGAAVQCGRLH